MVFESYGNMESTKEFFSKLRKLAVTVETETERLQRAFENRGNEDSDSGQGAVRARRAYHDVKSDVSSLKKQLLEELAEQKQQENEVSSFLKAYREMELKVSEDIHAIRTHLEKYGYRAPRDSEDPSTDATGPEAEEDETSTAAEEDANQEEDERGGSTPPSKLEQPVPDVLRTPHLSDFGLSELHLKRVVSGAEWCPEVPPMPEIRLPQPSLQTPPLPPTAMTPKRALWMDDDELQMPQMHDFGISGHTLCLNNDFTMDLLRKRDLQPKGPSQDAPVPTVSAVTERLQTKADSLESPELPLLCTQGFTTNKSRRDDLPSRDAREPEPPCHANLPTTPEVPAFQNPYLNRLVSTNKRANPEPTNLESDGDSHIFQLQTSPGIGTNGSKRPWEYNVPQMSSFDLESPEMPNLESVLGNSLHTRSGRTLQAGQKDKAGKDGASSLCSLDLDGATQELRFGTPRIRRNYQEPSTPKMPDLSSITQDIFKLVSQAQMKETMTGSKHLPVSSDKHKHSAPPAKGLSLVSQSEFQTLPPHLRLMTQQP
uniref:Spindle and kinetochore associated complex subunit 3 n=1 Tax=Fundulus heteroclitus TaxID=8078 RepID=A0A3Q2PKY6_FUNHE